MQVSQPPSTIVASISGPEGGERPISAGSGPVAYLTGVYPSMSHTFIQREVAGLRALGEEVVTCTVRRAPSETIVGDEQIAEAGATFCILEAARRPHRLLGAHLRCLWRSPRRWWGALRLAWAIRPPGLRAALWQLFYFAEAGVLADHLQARGARHIHNHLGDSSGSVALLTAEIAGIPFSYTMHGPTLFQEPAWWRIDEKTARAAFVVAISHFARSQGMLFSDRRHWSRFRIVHCGVEPALYGRRPRETFGARLLFVGRLAGVKGVPLLLEAVARLRAAHPDLHLTVVGEGDERAELEAQARTLDLDGVVTFTGVQSQAQIAERLEDSDILVLPSFAEGVPMVLMEAMASRIPVVATRVGGVQELVTDGESGLVVPPGCVDSLVGALDRLLSDPDLCRRMGLAGRLTVEAEFDIARETRWLQALLRGTAPDGKLRPGQY